MSYFLSISLMELSVELMKLSSLNGMQICLCHQNNLISYKWLAKQAPIRYSRSVTLLKSLDID
jgi:hypothetical protein